MRSCIGVRSWASSTIRWPCGAVGALEQRARLVEQRQVGVAPAPAAAGPEEALLVLVEDAVRGGGELLGARQQAPDELLGLRTRPERVERAVEEAAACGASPRCRRTSGRRRCRGAPCSARRSARRASCAGARARRRGRPISACASSISPPTCSGESRSSTPSRRTASSSAGGCGSARTAAAITSASRASPFSRATAGSLAPRRLDTATSSSTARCSTRSSPSMGRTCEM